MEEFLRKARVNGEDSSVLYLDPAKLPIVNALVFCLLRFVFKVKKEVSFS